MIFHSFNHPVETNLSSVRNERKDRILYLVIDKFYDPWNKPAAQFNTFVVNIFIIPSREIDALERTRLKLDWGFDFINRDLTVVLHNECISWRQFRDLLRFQIQCRLYDGTF